MVVHMYLPNSFATIIYPELGEKMDLCFSQVHYHKMRHKQPCSGFELWSPITFSPITIIIMLDVQHMYLHLCLPIIYCLKIYF